MLPTSDSEIERTPSAASKEKLDSLAYLSTSGAYSDGETPCKSSPSWRRELSGESADEAQRPKDLDLSRVSSVSRQAFNKPWRDGSVHDNFAWSAEDELGRGAFGRVFRGRSKYCQRKVVAIKQIPRGEDSVEDLLEEITVLSDLEHPNVLRLLEAYSDARFVYVITEVCLGGSLLEWLPEARGNLSFAERVSREITGALSHCHSRGICHRDLKPDNILFIRADLDSSIRIADFGLAKRCSQRVVAKRLEWSAARTQLFSRQVSTETESISEQPEPLLGPVGFLRLAPGLEAAPPKKPAKLETLETALKARQTMVQLRSVKGTPEYMAPEVLRVLNEQVNNLGEVSLKQAYYDFRCDVWSLGLIVHQMIMGRMPYSVYDVSFHVAEGGSLPPLDQCCTGANAEAMAFVQTCLNPSFKTRASADELLHHPWLNANRQEARPTAASAHSVVARLCAFAKLSKFKRAVLMVAVRHMGSFEYEELRLLFAEVDSGHRGVISASRLKEWLATAEDEVVSKSPDSNVERPSIEEAAELLDLERRGQIHYTQFMAAMMDPNIEEREDLCKAVFAFFDCNNDGTISKHELKRVLHPKCAEDIIKSVDTNKDGDLTFDGFVALLRKG